MRFERQLVDAAIVYLVFGSIAAVVFSNQPDQAMQLVGRVFHLLNIAASCYLVLTVMGVGAAGYVAVVALLFVLDKIAGTRLPYIVFLNVLFLFAGAAAIARNRDLITTTLAVIVIASGIMMFLQVAGVGEWTQLLTTHGTVSDGANVPKAPHPAFFVGYYESAANFLQGRPAGLFHSNQFGSLLILVSLALVMSGRRAIAAELLLCFVAVLSLSKAVFLGIALLCVFYFFRDRGKAIRIASFTAIGLAVYAVLFPGLFQIFLANPEIFWTSVVVRLVDFGAAAFGWDRDAVLAALDFMKSEGCSDCTVNREFVEGVVMRAATSQRVSSFSVLAPFTPILISIFAVATFVFLTSKRARTRIREVVKTGDIAVFISLYCFCLASNFLNAQIFWLYMGFAVPLGILTMAGIQTDKTRHEEA